MTKAAKIAIFGVPVLIGIYLIYLQLRRSKGAKPGNYIPPPTPRPNVSDSGSGSGSGSGSSSGSSSTCKFELRNGIYNCDKVELLQWALNRIPVTKYKNTGNLVKYRPLKEDGDFGPKTEAVLMDLTGYYMVLTQKDLDDILAMVVADPIEFQAEENKYIMAPKPQEPNYNSGIIWNNPF